MLAYGGQHSFQEPPLPVAFTDAGTGETAWIPLSATPLTGPAPLTVNFTDASTASPTSRLQEPAGPALAPTAGPSAVPLAGEPMVSISPASEGTTVGEKP